MIRGKTRTWDIPIQPGSGSYAVRWTTMICRECRDEYLRYWEDTGDAECLVVGVECFHLTEDQWAPDFRRDLFLQ